ncbi:MAG: inositol-3-phosphate synthase [Ignavibacteriae bacterium]|nr:MAG: inositol-3-phosphate synthase [Ignavibacteriota bacterium]
MNTTIKPKTARGRLGVLIVGLNGAVSTTFLAGTIAVRKGIAEPVGSLTQLASIRLGKRSDNKFPKIKDFVPLTDLNDLVFGGWDIRDEDCYKSALYAGVLSEKHIESVKDELSKLKPMKAVFDQKYVTRLHGDWVKKADSKFGFMNLIREDIRKFKAEQEVDRIVMIWCASTEIFISPNGVHKDIKTFETAMRESHSDISPSMLYAYAALAEGVPFINGAPNLSVDSPALVQFARMRKVPVAGKDFKTGQTLLKTVIAPMLKAKMLGLRGWFSSNILGNRDGEVLDDPDSFKTKEQSKLSVLDVILQPNLYPNLYGSYHHMVRINYYPPRGDDKEGWDNIDIFGWMGYPMQLKINFLCKDSILAAPLVLDLILFMDLAQRKNMYGIQDWLSFFFKSPMHLEKATPEHDLFIQHMKLKNTLRKMMGEKPISHLDETETVKEFEAVFQ